MVARRLAVVLAGASMALTSVGVASAHETDAVASKVTIDVTRKGFKGNVNSSEDFCFAERKVTLYKSKSGNKVDSTKTDLDGKWSIKVSDAKGKYYVKISRTIDEFTEDTYHHLHECNSDTSDNVKA